MKIRWRGVVLVIVLAVGVLLLKHLVPQETGSPGDNSTPAVILVADLGEANKKGDPCAEIIQAVSQASKQGVHVAELMPNANSSLLQRYRVHIVPTVLLLDRNGKQFARFEGEDPATVEALKARLADLSGARR